MVFNARLQRVALRWTWEVSIELMYLGFIRGSGLHVGVEVLDTLMRSGAAFVFFPSLFAPTDTRAFSPHRCEDLIMHPATTIDI